jgi:hypothetical protein
MTVNDEFGSRATEADIFPDTVRKIQKPQKVKLVTRLRTKPGISQI